MLLLGSLIAHSYLKVIYKIAKSKPPLFCDDVYVCGNVSGKDIKKFQELWVEAYNVDSSISYLGHTRVQKDGYFRINIPKEAYRCIPLVHPYPNIFLLVRDKYRILHREPEYGFRVLVSTGFNNYFNIEIKEPVLYSDQITHMPWRWMLRRFLLDSTDQMSLEDFEAISPQMAEPIEDQIYATKEGWDEINYTLPGVPKRPKATSHREHVKWDPHIPDGSTWEDMPKQLPVIEQVQCEGKIFGLERIPKREFPYEVVTHDIVEQDVDVCIIGSGAAGALLANKLALGKGEPKRDGNGELITDEHGNLIYNPTEPKKVVLIEKGGYYDREDFNQREIDMMRLLWKNGGAQLTEDGRTLIAQGEVLGGSTVINDAVCFKIPEIVSEDWRDNFGINYTPKDWDELYEQIENEIHIIAPPISAPSSQPWSAKLAFDKKIRKRYTDLLEKNSRLKTSPKEEVALFKEEAIKEFLEAPDEATRTGIIKKVGRININGRIFQQACQVSGYREDLNEHGFNNRNVKDSQECGFCHLACHYDRKQSTLIAFLHEALKKVEKDNLKIYCNCSIERLLHKKDPDNPGKNIITGVEGNFQQRKGFPIHKIRINAKVVIVSGGAISSSRLLLRNNIAQGKAGQKLAIHPSTVLMAMFPKTPIDQTDPNPWIDPEDLPIYASMGVPMYYSLTKFSVLNKEQSDRFMIESIFTPPYQLSLQLPQSLPNGRDPMLDFNYYAMAGVMVKDKSVGKISLGNFGGAKINYDINDDDKEQLIKGVRTLAEMWFKRGAKIVLTGHLDKPILKYKTRKNDIKELGDRIRDNFKDLKRGSAHPQGGNIMGGEERKDESVVDQHCQVYDFQNLFVCDASVFPTSIGVNPQVTVMSIATICGNYINKNWDSIIDGIRPTNFTGHTCDITQPRFCNEERLGTMFYQRESNNSLFQKLVNAEGDKLSDEIWSIDENLIIKNDLHWRGFVPDFKLSDPNDTRADTIRRKIAVISDTIKQEFNFYNEIKLGFTKKFWKKGDAIEGVVKPYGIDKEFCFIATKANFGKAAKDVYGNMIHLKYSGLNSGFYDLLKIVDEDTVLGQGYIGIPPFYGTFVLPFVMTKKYPAVDMDIEDHKFIFKNHSKPTLLTQVFGRWDIRIFRNDLLIPIDSEPPNIKFVYFESDYDYRDKVDALKEIIIEELRKISIFNFDIEKLYELILEALGKLSLLTSNMGPSHRWQVELREIEDSHGNIHENFLVGKLYSPKLGVSFKSGHKNGRYSKFVEELPDKQKRLVIPFVLSYESQKL